MDDAGEDVDDDPGGRQADGDAQQIGARLDDIGAHGAPDHLQDEDKGDRSQMGDDAAHDHAQQRRPALGERQEIDLLTDRGGNSGGDDGGEPDQAELDR